MADRRVAGCLHARRTDVTTAVQLGAALLSASGQCATIVVHMPGRVFCDFASLSALLQAHPRAMVYAGQVRLVITTTQVPRIWAGFHAHFLWPRGAASDQTSVTGSPRLTVPPAITSA